ncbi:MAG: hypothetical protein QOG62_1675 [Thermoleophilaceae bacterium]|nr:hypothetical protein [Thermoleophilaceae bacterium]
MDELRQYERELRRAGLPLLIEDRSASKDIFNRAFPLLALVFMGELLGALNLTWSFLANIGALAGALVVVMAGVALLNRVRGREAMAIPEDVGPLELIGFVLIPSLLPLMFGGQTTSALVTAASNILLLLVVYLGFGLGIGSIFQWASRRLVRQVRASFDLVARALPLLLVFANVLFLTAELWQVSLTLSHVFAALFVVLLSLLATAFVGIRIPREVSSIERDVDADGPPLSRAQRFNVGLVMFVSQALQVLVVSVAVAGFFIVVGALLVNSQMRTFLMQTNGSVLLSFDLFGQPVEITRELLRVSVGIAAFSGFYYAVAVLTDSSYRQEFLTEFTDELRETFEIRSRYLDLRERTGAGVEPTRPY